MSQDVHMTTHRTFTVILAAVGLTAVSILTANPSHASTIPAPPRGHAVKTAQTADLVECARQDTGGTRSAWWYCDRVTPQGVVVLAVNRSGNLWQNAAWTCSADRLRCERWLWPTLTPKHPQPVPVPAHTPRPLPQPCPIGRVCPS
jgi:hypothetical protein